MTCWICQNLMIKFLKRFLKGFKPNVNILRAEYMRFYCKISITFYLLLKTILFVDKRVASIEILLF